MTVLQVNRLSLVAALLSCLAAGAMAQTPDEAQMRALMEQAREMKPPSAENMQQFAAQAQAMQACMADIDQGVLESMRRDGEAVRNEVSALCAAGQRDAAEERMMAYGKQVAASTEMKKMAECSKGMASMMPSLMPFAAQSGEQARSAHVCDDL